MSDSKAPANTGLPSVASMSSSSSMTLDDVSRLAANSKSDGPAISGVSEDTAIPLDGDTDPTPAAAPAQDAPRATQAAPAAVDKKPAEDGDLLKLPDDLPPVETPQQPDPAPVPGEKPTARNYADYPEELHPVLKSLNNAKFAELAPKLKELHTQASRAKQLETDLAEARKGPQFFYEHPEGYKLSPEYAQVEQQLGMCDFEIEHWRNQLIAIKSGQPWTNLRGYQKNPQTGAIEPVFETRAPLGDGKVDNAAEVAVMQILQQSGVARQTLYGRAQGIINGYAQSGERAKAELGEIDKRLFAKLGDVTKLPAEEVKHYDLAKSAVPRYFQGHPLVDMLGKAFVMYNRLLQRTITAQTEVEKLRGEIAGRKAALPTRIPPGGGNGKPAKDDLEIKFEEL